MSKSRITKQLMAELNGLLAQIERMQKQADGLRSTIEYLENKEKTENGTPVPNHKAQKGQGAPSAFVQDMINVLMDNSGLPMHYRKIHEALVRRGIRVGGNDPVRNVSAHLSLNKEFFKSCGSGMWGLADDAENSTPKQDNSDPSEADYDPFAEE